MFKVSSPLEKETHSQIDALNAAGVEVIYQGRTSSVGVRPERQKCLGRLGKGDVLVVYKIDRIARSILGAVAQLERGIIRERSIAPQQAAIAQGVKVGRRRALSAEDEAEVVRLYETGLHTLNGLGTRFGVSLSVIKRAVYRVRDPGHSSLR